jgi:hypothetical protein
VKQGDQVEMNNPESLTKVGEKDRPLPRNANTLKGRFERLSVFGFLKDLRRKWRLYNISPAKRASKLELREPVFFAEMGDGNEFLRSGAKSLKGKVFIKRGSGNTVSIGADTIFDGTIIISGHGNRVILGQNCHYRGDILVKGNNQTVTFGDHSTTVGVYILCSEGYDVTIGKWCMFSRDIEIRTTDAHSVIERASGKRINGPASVEIGDHVWVGVGAIVNKGAIIPVDSIVGARAFVNKAFNQPGVILAGAPAVVVKSGITWNRLRKKQYTSEEMNHWIA